MLRRTFVLGAPLAGLTWASRGYAAAPVASSAFEFAFVGIDGKPMPFSDYRGKALLVVNTASFCGFTPQYEGLQTLHERYETKGLVVIGVPANDFGAQEPKGNAEIASFCQGAFNVTFPLTEKQIVKGKDAHPFYAWARQVLGEASTPRWNFHKYLVDREGRLVGAFPSTIEPQSSTLVGAIEAALGAPKS